MSTNQERAAIAAAEAIGARKVQIAALAAAKKAINKGENNTKVQEATRAAIRATLNKIMKGNNNNKNKNNSSNNNNKGNNNNSNNNNSNNNNSNNNNSNNNSYNNSNNEVNEYYRYNKSGFVMPVEDPANTAAREARAAMANQKPLSQEGGRKRKTNKSLTRKIMRVPQGAVNTSLSLVNTARKGTVKAVERTGRGAVGITRSAINTGRNVSKNAIGTLGKITTKTVKGLTNLLKNSINVAANFTSGTLKRVTRKNKRTKH